MRTLSALQGFINTFPPLWAVYTPANPAGQSTGDSPGILANVGLTLWLDASCGIGVIQAGFGKES
jgi:hypothetical protein